MTERTTSTMKERKQQQQQLSSQQQFQKVCTSRSCSSRLLAPSTCQTNDQWIRIINDDDHDDNDLRVSGVVCCLKKDTTTNHQRIDKENKRKDPSNYPLYDRRIHASTTSTSSGTDVHHYHESSRKYDSQDQKQQQQQYSTVDKDMNNNTNSNIINNNNNTNNNNLNSISDSLILRMPPPTTITKIKYSNQPNRCAVVRMSPPPPSSSSSSSSLSIRSSSSLSSTSKLKNHFDRIHPTQYKTKTTTKRRVPITKLSSSATLLSTTTIITTKRNNLNLVECYTGTEGCYDSDDTTTNEKTTCDHTIKQQHSVSLISPTESDIVKYFESLNVTSASSKHSYLKNNSGCSQLRLLPDNNHDDDFGYEKNKDHDDDDDHHHHRTSCTIQNFEKDGTTTTKIQLPTTILVGGGKGCHQTPYHHQPKNIMTNNNKNNENSCSSSTSSSPRIVTSPLTDYRTYMRDVCIMNPVAAMFLRNHDDDEYGSNHSIRNNDNVITNLVEEEPYNLSSPALPPPQSQSWKNGDYDRKPSSSSRSRIDTLINVITTNESKPNNVLSPPILHPIIIKNKKLMKDTKPHSVVFVCDNHAQQRQQQQRQPQQKPLPATETSFTSSITTNHTNSLNESKSSSSSFICYDDNHDECIHDDNHDNKCEDVCGSGGITSAFLPTRTNTRFGVSSTSSSSNGTKQQQQHPPLIMVHPLPPTYFLKSHNGSQQVTRPRPVRLLNNHDVSNEWMANGWLTG